MSVLRPLDDFNFHHTLEDTDGTGLVLFSNEGCSACRSWKQLLTQQLPPAHGLTLFEVDAGHNPGLVREFEVFHLPSLFLYVKGRYQAAIHCEARPSALLAEIEAASRRPAEEAP